MPATGAASAAAPQKQRPKTKAKPAIPRVKKAKPAAPRMKKRQPKTVPVVVPLKSETASVQKQSSKNVPETVYCHGCAQAFPHGRYIKCPNCGRFWGVCEHHKDSQGRSRPPPGSSWRFWGDGEHYEDGPRWLSWGLQGWWHDARKCANISALHPDCTDRDYYRLHRGMKWREWRDHIVAVTADIVRRVSGLPHMLNGGWKMGSPRKDALDPNRPDPDRGLAQSWHAAGRFAPALHNSGPSPAAS